ncbi:hypothetical protein C7449_10812 [Mycoplana dimorpha]|uniref:Uncharacterized protein n=1 Tax=Mycoplana dimorpha TaxID=28320 RepID=A0A2T5AZ07_MYCDI|nr:hypothetical protein C7449_10812 [Mycoplana dimorpha]
MDSGQGLNLSAHALAISDWRNSKLACHTMKGTLQA